MSKYQTHQEYKKDWVELSNIEVDGEDIDNFLIDIFGVMNDNEEYRDLEKKPKEEVTEQQKEVKGAGNIFDIKHFIRDNFDEIKTNKELQAELKAKIERLKKLLKPDGTEYAQLLLLENHVNDMLNEGIEDDD